MNKEQRNDIIKLLYDLIKLTYTGLIIGGIISPKGLLFTYVVSGFIVTFIFFVLAYWLRRKE